MILFVITRQVTNTVMPGKSVERGRCIVERVPTERPGDFPNFE